jgi:hypothetical protein
VAGVVRRLRIDPRQGVIRATITDGVNSLDAEWPICRPAAQLRAAPGTGLLLEGVARVDKSGRLLMVEPSFEILLGPGHE